jgi:UDP-3-O-[3-hydroxymyristoyl] glucosamine N-acyltransferase
MMRLQQLAAKLGLSILGSPVDWEIDGVSSIESARAGMLVFATDATSTTAALRSAASAAILPQDLIPENPSKAVLMSANPRLDFARAGLLLRPERDSAVVHATATVQPEATVAESVSLGAFTSIGARAKIGERTVIGEGAVIGEEVTVGADCHIYPRVVIYPGTTIGDRVVVHAGAVLGADGFGYVRDPATGQYIQFPQRGTLIIEDDAEIGANTTIDRGALDATVIERGTKIDNLVHLGHNVHVGRNTVIAALVGISGSTTIGADVMLGGQVGIGDHAEVGDGVILGGQGGILPHKKLHGAGKVFWGTPAQPLAEFLRDVALLRRLRRQERRRAD